MDDIARRTAHLILDLLSAIDVDEDSDAELPDGWADDIAVQMAKVGAVRVDLDLSAELPKPIMDITPMMVAITGLLELQIDRLIEDTGEDRLTAIATLREHLDQRSAD